MFVDGNARVAVIENLLEGVEVEMRVDVEREDVLDRHHGLLDALVLEVERARYQLVLLLLDVLALLGLTHQLAHLVARERRRDLLAQEQREQLAQRIRERRRQAHHHVRHISIHIYLDVTKREREREREGFFCWCVCFIDLVYAPTARPYREQMACGMISPNRTMRRVEPTAANMPSM